VSDLGPSEATARYAAATSTDYRLIGPLAGGETGATAIEDVSGARRVLKWETDPDRTSRRIEAIGLTERLRRDAGWPVPRQHAIDDDGVLLVSQELMSGSTVERLTHRLVDDLSSIHRRRLGLADVGDRNGWGDDMIETLVEGGNGYCLHEPLRRHSTQTRRIVERIEAIGRAMTASDLFGADIVHGDLHPGNLLQRGGQLSAVVDLDFARVGDAAFDLACLAIASLGIAAEPGVRRRLFAEGIDVLDTGRRGAYVGHLLLRLLDWPIRKDRPLETDFWVARSDRLLAGID
jgi:thiamine kinase-like enzyme